MSDADNPDDTKRIRRKEVTLSIPVMKVPHWLQGFVDFIRSQGVVGLAVGLILGVASKSVVDSFVQDIINPFIGLFFGGGDLSSKYICLKSVEGVCTNKLAWGNFVNEIISFLIMAAVVYFVIKGLRLDKLDKVKDD